MQLCARDEQFQETYVACTVMSHPYQGSTLYRVSTTLTPGSEHGMPLTEIIKSPEAVCRRTAAFHFSEHCTGVAPGHCPATVKLMVSGTLVWFPLQGWSMSALKITYVPWLGVMGMAGMGAGAAKMLDTRQPRSTRSKHLNAMEVWI